MRHLTEAEVHDLVDDGAADSASAAHLIKCDECATRVRRLRALRSRLSALPLEVAPARDLLPGITAEIARESRPAARAARRPLLAAAAAAFIVVGAAAAAVLLRDRSVPPAAVVPRAGVVQLAELQAAEAHYVDAIAELRSAVDAGVLDADTRAVVERSLDTIDRALAEARTALAADPANAALAELLRAGYEKKLDLLRRASTHGRGSL